MQTAPSESTTCRKPSPSSLHKRHARLVRWFVAKTVKRYPHLVPEASDLYQQYWLGILAGVEMWDPAKVSFTTFAVSRMKNELKHVLRQTTPQFGGPSDAEGILELDPTVEFFDILPRVSKGLGSRVGYRNAGVYLDSSQGEYSADELARRYNLSRQRIYQIIDTTRPVYEEVLNEIRTEYLSIS